MIITLLLHLRASSMRGREPRNAVEDLALRGRNPERFISARLRLPGVKRNGRGHRRAKRRPPRLPPLCLMRYATTSPAELPDYLPYGRPFSATVAYSSPRPSASRSLSSSSTPWPNHTILLTDMSGWSQPSRTERVYFVSCVVCTSGDLMEIQIAIWTPDETHSSVRSWQPIF